MLKIGNKAPTFNLIDDRGQAINSAALKGQRYVLYFYPKDDTPGCTKEACGFRDNLPAFNSSNVKVFGVSADSQTAHEKFVRKYGLNFPLLADTEHKLIKAYGVWVEKSMYGKKYMGIARSTFVINSDGVIEQVWEKVSPEQHAQEVHAYLKGESSSSVPVVKKATAKKSPAKKAAAKKAAKKQTAAKKSTAKKAAKKVVAKATKKQSKKVVKKTAKKK
jgi:thioredoxin-dependent peroxiredoxin